MNNMRHLSFASNDLTRLSVQFVIYYGLVLCKKLLHAITVIRFLDYVDALFKLYDMSKKIGRLNFMPIYVTSS